MIGISEYDRRPHACSMVVYVHVYIVYIRWWRLASHPPAHMWVHACVRAWMDGPPRGSSCCVGGVLVIWTSNDGFHTIVRRLLHSSANAVFWICRCIKVHVLGTEMILRDSQASATATGWTTRCTRVRTIPGPKTPTAPENEALAYGWICLFT